MKTLDKNDYNQIEDAKERAVLVALTDTSKDSSDEETLKSIEELELLAKTAGAVVVGTAIQRRHGVDGKSYVGKGKLQEIKNACEELDATLIIFDDELLGSQIRSIEEITEMKVIDRTLLILDIFAQRAKSKEGKLQVELAQQKYRYSRLVGLGVSLSRLGGGIGTRGPGESKLESDRRHLKRRIDFLKDSINEISIRRERIRDKRHDGDAITIAVVGYTNAGKSTLINKLCSSDLFVEDMLFATLDPTARSLTLPDGHNVVLIDTVGFIRKLPHNLIEAFKSTLEELSDADIIMHVVDSSDTDLTRHMEIVEELMEQLDSAAKPRITVFNKADKLTLADEPSSNKTSADKHSMDMLSVDKLSVDKHSQDKFSEDTSSTNKMTEPKTNPVFNGKEGTVVSASAITGAGLDVLLDAISQLVKSMKVRMKVLIPYDKGQLLDYARKNGSVENIEYLNEGISATISLPPSKTAPLNPFISK
jgi:GTP-binding protein HflX